ncbi:MAG: metal ABC transporter ATP-binding protein [Verrucomicrobiota bacterium JB022]|nr:metal ABC transporter ATP-binding protein [Verrucomicrobiota bacterium JB022]
MSPSDPAIECRHVSYSYGREYAVERVDLRIEPRETVCLVGPNGGGKSTLLKLFLGLIEPQDGEVRLLGGRPKQTRHRVGYMPQRLEFDRKLPISVREVVSMGRLRRPWGWMSRADRQQIEARLEELELRDIARQPFASLSGGQQQRVLIARALAVEPEVLLLDEPTAMTDAFVEARLVERLRALHQQMAIVLVSHDIAFVRHLVDRVICVQRQAETHPVEAVTPELIERWYGGPVHAVRHDHTEEGHHHG